MSLDSQPNNLPPILNKITTVAGFPAALAICKARGGRELYVPKIVAGSTLETLVGAAAAEKIVEAFGVGNIRIPFWQLGGACARRNGVRRSISDGLSVAKAALQNGVHTRTVKRIKARQKKPDDHPDLFR